MISPVPPSFCSASKCALQEKAEFLENLKVLQKDNNTRTLERIKSLISNKAHFVISGIKFFYVILIYSKYLYFFYFFAVHIKE